MAKTWEQEAHEGEDVVARVKRELRADRDGMAQDHRRMGEEVRAALELVQYREQEGQDRSSAHNVWPTTAGPFRLWRYKKAMIRLNYPININVEPRDQVDDPSRAKAAKRYLEYELVHSKWKRYGDVRDRWVGAAQAMRAGGYRWDFVPDLGEEGEILPRLFDARMVSWPSGFLDPHDPLNPRFSMIFRIPVNEARRNPNWKGTDKLKSDGGFEFLDTMLSGGLEDVTTDYVGRDRGPSGASEIIGGDGFFTGVVTWYRFEPYVPKIKRPLDAMDQYMSCDTCGFQTPPLGQIPEQSMGFQFPPEAPGGCIECGGNLALQTEREMTLTEARQAKGKRMVIACLNGSVTKALYDGPWQCPIARSFPIAWLTGYRYPHKRLPESDPAIHWTTMVGANYSLAAAYKQAHRARGLWLLPEHGLKDRNGIRYDFGDDQDDTAFYDARDFPPQGINHVEAPPLQEALFKLYDMLTGSFRENEGTSDMGLTPEQSKDIPVGTIDQLTETGNVPIDDFGQDVYDAEAMSFGILLDYIRWFGTTAKAIRFYNDAGAVEWDKLKGADLPDADVIVSAGARMSQVRKEEIQAYQQLVALPGPRRRRVATLMGLDPQIVNDMDDDDIATIQWQANLDAMAAQFGQPPGGQTMPGPIQDRMNGNGNPAPQGAMNGSAA